MPLIGPRPADAAAVAAPAPGVAIEIGDGVRVQSTNTVPHQPRGGFSSATEALDWRRAQLWLDTGFDAARPAHGVAAVSTGADGWRLLELDSSLRVARGGLNESVAGWRAVDGEVGEVLDGLGMQLAKRQPAPLAGTLLEPRAVTFAPPDLDRALTLGEKVFTLRNAAIAGGIGAVAVGAMLLRNRAND